MIAVKHQRWQFWNHRFSDDGDSFLSIADQFQYQTCPCGEQRTVYLGKDEQAWEAYKERERVAWEALQEKRRQCDHSFVQRRDRWSHEYADGVTDSTVCWKCGYVIAESNYEVG